MGLGQKLLGGSHGHADDGIGGHIRRARLYEISAAIGFAGFRRRIYDNLITLSGAKPGDRILDVGCGTGYLTRRAAHAVTPGGHVVGVDPSPPVIDYATRTAPPNCTIHLATAEAIPEPDAAFDVVMSSLAIHHLPPRHRPTAFHEMHRVLRPGGQPLIADFRPPRNRLANHLIGALSGQHNPSSSSPNSSRRRLPHHRQWQPAPLAALHPGTTTNRDQHPKISRIRKLSLTKVQLPGQNFSSSRRPTHGALATFNWLGQ